VGFKQAGGVVNIETDMIGKYVERFTVRQGYGGKENKTGPSSIDRGFLEKAGFF